MNTVRIVSFPVMNYGTSSLGGGPIKPLSFQVTHGVPTVIAKVGSPDGINPCSIHVVNTGEMMPDGLRYIGTAESSTGLLLHAFY